MTRERRRQQGGEAPPDEGLGVGGLLQSLGGFLDLVSQLAETGQELRRSGELGDDARGVKAVYGFSVRAGGGKQTRIEPFGNVIKKGTRGPVVDEEREPMVDVFDEGPQILVIAELPGVEEADIRYTIADDVLSLTAHRGDRRYAKRVHLPAKVAPEAAGLAFRNGVLELTLSRTGE